MRTRASLLRAGITGAGEFPAAAARVCGGRGGGVCVGRGLPAAAGLGFGGASGVLRCGDGGGCGAPVFWAVAGGAAAAARGAGLPPAGGFAAAARAGLALSSTRTEPEVSRFPNMGSSLCLRMAGV
ncbi:MAG: hypothetical protein MPK06_06135 [Alphaproteobacteria bacterium]|nr:hypothetical protein [Alphaproteobacteria bacterium]MDA8006098.1 hypothetical protein [Alphaproteobacteria bacterium]